MKQITICRVIVDAHGGRLRASANKPYRAIFQVTLPSGRLREAEGTTFAQQYRCRLISNSSALKKLDDAQKYLERMGRRSGGRPH